MADGRGSMRQSYVVVCAVVVALGCASVERQYASAVRSRNEERIRRFIHRHPESPLVMSAAAVLDSVRFEKAARDTGVASLQRFLQQYPASRLAPAATVLLAQRMKEAEIRRLTQEVERDPQPSTILALADLHRERGDDEVAKDLYLRALSMDPSLATAHTGLAHLYLRAGMLDQADAEIEEAQRLAPMDVSVLLAAGEYYRLVGRPDLAMGAFQKVVNAAPQNLEAHMKLGMLYLDVGQNRSAIWEFLKVREIDPKHVPALYYLGVAYADQNDVATALRYLDQYLRSPHTHEEADLLDKAQALRDRLASEYRPGGSTAGGVIPDPSNPAQSQPAPAGQGREGAQRPPQVRPPQDKRPVGFEGPWGGRGGGKKGG